MEHHVGLELNLRSTSSIFFFLPLTSCIFLISSELAMILSMAQTNPVMFGMVSDTPGVSQQLERMGRLKELLETDQGELKKKQRDDWIRWVSRYR